MNKKNRSLSKILFHAYISRSVQEKAWTKETLSSLLVKIERENNFEILLTPFYPKKQNQNTSSSRKNHSFGNNKLTHYDANTIMIQVKLNV